LDLIGPILRGGKDRERGMGKGEERGGGADEGVWREGGEYASLALGGWTPLFI